MNNEHEPAEEALRKSEERHRAIILAAMDGFWMVDLEGRLLEVNSAYCRMSGYSEPELLGMGVAELEVPEAGEPVAVRIAGLIEKGEDRFETRHRRKDGSIIDVEVSARYCAFEEGRAFAFLRDITERRRADEARMENETFIKSVMDNLPIGIAVNSVDPAVSFQYMNDNFTGFYRTTREALVSPDAFWNAVYEDPDFREEIRKRVLGDCASGDPEKMHWADVPITRTGDRTTYVEARNTLIPDKQLMVSTVWDVTGRKEVELALRERKEQLRVIFDASQAGIILVDPQGTIQLANNRMAEMFGMPLGQLIGSSYSGHLHDTERQTGDERMGQLIRGDVESVSTERHFIRADGSDFWGFLSGKRLENPDGTLRALVGIIADITERKQANEALRESENRLRFALEGTNDGLWDVQMKTGTTYLSPRGWETLGYPPDEVGEINNAWADLVHPDDLPLAHERLRAHIEGETPIFEVEQRLRMKSGDWKWVLARGKVVSRDQDGVPLRMTGTHTDLTEQKKLHEQLIQAQKMESVGRLAGGVAHDFNNMLNVILGHAELARIKEAVSPALREHLEQIQKAAERSADIVSQLLAFARKQTITPRVLDLNERVESMLKMLRRLIGEGIDLALLPAEVLWPVRMDPSQIDQILANLCVNARDAIAGVGRITIETENRAFDAVFCSGHRGFVPGEYVLLTVSDDGCGMDKETLAKIFEPFFTTKGVGQGTGLGLAMVFGIVKQNNGFIDVHSEPGQGTTAKIYLPRHRGKEEQARTAAPTEPAKRGRETVLLVEDEPVILDLGKQLLEMQGYRVLTAGTPGEAIRLAEEQIGEIHLLLTDVIMPEMNGRELARKLLALHPGLKRLFMSGYTADVIAHHGVLDEGMHFIQKPFSLNALADKVRDVLDH